MLPSTGYFNGINCPFYESGLCERPYCHFRHIKQESLNSVNENGEILHKLVSAAVQKVLQQTEASSTSSLTNAQTTDSCKDGLQNLTATSKATYNPTPISKLNKINSSDTENIEESNEQRRRHIPVPYTPRKPASLPIKRSVDHDDFTPFIYNPGSTNTTQLDPYTPKGTVELKEKYLPGTDAEVPEYAPKNDNDQSSIKHSYVPSDKSVNKKKILEYEPAKVVSKNDLPHLKYQPTPRSLVPCFSSDEEEIPEKKRKLSSDLNGLDELGAEFDILDQILVEENVEQNKTNQSNHNKSKSEKNLLTSKIEPQTDKERKSNKDKSKKHSSKRSEEKTKSEKDKSNNDKHETKSQSSYKKSKHKSSSKDKVSDLKHKEVSKDKKKEKDSYKDKVKDKDKHKKERQNNHSNKSDKKHSSSKSSRNSSKDSKHSEKSKHSKSSDKDSKKEKSKKHSSKDRSSKKSIHKSNGVSESDDDIGANLSIDEQYVDSSDCDEEAIALECKKIFEEYVPSEKSDITEHSKCEDTTEIEYIAGKKRVSRAAEKNIKIISKPPIKPDFKVSAAQAMAERLAKVREYHAAKKAVEIMKNESESNLETSKNIPPTPGGSSKIRIAHVPYASTLMTAKKTISLTPKPAKSEPGITTTITQTIKRGEKRVAHMPSEKFIDRPGVLEPLASKIPANIRTTYLNMMIDECLKIYLSATDAYSRAQHEELATSKKCSTNQIYKNSAVLTVSRLRKELQECKGVKKSGSDCTVLQKTPQTITGSSAGSWSIEMKNKKFIDNKEFRGAKLYENIKKWILTEEQLQENGFPRPHASGEKGRAIIYGQNKQKPPVGYIRTCCRCKKNYTVNKKNFPAVKEECIYHPNNKYRVRGEAKYQCCSQDASSDGCCIAPTHVYEYVDFNNLKGYVKTLPSEKSMDSYGVYSLDCEMCYTTHGLDLTRVTVIDSDCKVIYETLVKPLHPIIDYNTRYSGITEEQMEGVKTTLLEVQATLLIMFNSKTILIGHSLESDFKALKLIHDTVIDTSVLFPHKMGPPYKRALRNLSSEYLKKIIQNSIDGHDSAEDATVCMELIHFKLKEDLKTR